MAKTIDPTKKLLSSDLIPGGRFRYLSKSGSLAIITSSQRNLSNLQAIVMTNLDRNVAESMYEKLIVMTNRQAIVLTIKSNSRTAVFSGKSHYDTIRQTQPSLSQDFAQSRTMAAQWLNNRLQTPLVKSNMPLTQKHRFPHCDTMPKTIDRTKKSYPKATS
jgi:hypothetical protein